ncbi:MAG: PAS domain-containing sensor histidine kinase [Actinobacteria bacterium]|nr:PAS domain-containing sensor histidine kinase [Actinomycetota bacterium]
MSLLDRLPDAVLRVDADGRITDANAAAATLTGFDVGALVGEPCTHLLRPRTPDGVEVWSDGWHRSVALRSVRAIPEQEVTLTRANGSDVKAFVTAAYERNGDGGLDGAVLVLRSAATRLHRATAGIEIVSTVSHELRSPLTSVKGYTSLLLNRWDRLADDQKRMMLEQVNHDADRVTRLITELLDISRLETGRLVLRRQMVDLAAIAQSVVDKVVMEYPNLDVTLTFADDFPHPYADPDKVEQVLTNLVENACKYGSAQGLMVMGELVDRQVAVSVTDQGDGIATDDVPRVFDKFFRRAEGKPTGSGLGLWISRGLVEAHGGRLTASSIPGQGTTFRFTLPLITIDELHPT